VEIVSLHRNVPEAGNMVGLFRLPVSVTVAAVLLAACDSGTGPDGGEEEPIVVGQVEVNINTESERKPISPFIYGSNQDRAADTWTVRRFGGNRLTGYNWENNFSNAGSDYLHSSDLFLLSNANIPVSEAAVPARAVTHFHDQSRALGAASIVTLQMAGYVAADGAGAVGPSETAPSARWVKVEPRKNAAFTNTPDVNDGVAYMDELVNLLVSRYGGASSSAGVRWYSLDNEPALWTHTHPRIHPEAVGVEELLDRSIDLASAVKAVDPSSEILGPALYGMTAYVSLQDAPDWNAVRAGYDWFIDYYLDHMRQAEQRMGKRLLDVLDVHWYPEARGDHRITESNATTQSDNDARVQAPRTLWDPTYRENSWIGASMGAYLPLLPKLQQSIARYYPGTRLAITEYNYGGGGSISGGLAQTDVLGIFGKHDVHIATLWGIGPSDEYTSAAFKLYRNYDGSGSTFGNTSVRATTDDPAGTSIYAAIDGQDTSVLHIILLNRNRLGALDVRFTIQSTTSYTSAQVWGFDGASAAIRTQRSPTTIAGNTFNYVLPTLSAVHLVLRK
jgi:mannan endo-1,4-beta-mannosidase